MVTGAEGLIGSVLTRTLARQGVRVAPLDVAACGDARGDVRDAEAVRSKIASCCGVIHLAAVSRVTWAERDPATCWATNIGGTENVLRAALTARHRPWVLFASSREVYGRARTLPVREDAPLEPINRYGRSKREAEGLVARARDEGLRAAVMRFANVYGETHDHPDRVVPAFARAAAFGRCLVVEGADQVYDFTHVDDVVRGIAAAVDRLQRDDASLPTIHLASGRGTTLRELANLAVRSRRSSSEIREGAARAFGVDRFIGDPTRAWELLGWRAEVELDVGVRSMVDAFSREAA